MNIQVAKSVDSEVHMRGKLTVRDVDKNLNDVLRGSLRNQSAG